MASIIEQIFTQAGGGPTAQGQSLPLVEAFQRGQQMRLKRQAFQLEKVKTIEDIETENLNQQLLQQTIRFNRKEEKRKKAEFLFNTQKEESIRDAQVAASGMLSDVMGNPEKANTPEFQADFFTLMEENPFLIETDQGNALINYMQLRGLGDTMQRTRQTVPTPGGGTATFETPQEIDPLRQFEAQMRSVEAKLRAQQLQIQAQRLRSGLGPLDRQELDARIEQFTSSLPAMKMGEQEAADRIRSIIDDFRNRLPGGNQGSIFGDIEIPDAPEIGPRGDQTRPSREAIFPRSEQRRLRQGSSQNLGQDFDFQFNSDTGRLEPAR